MSRPARGPRPAKVQEWSTRLARFRASRMSVADFCRAESVSPASLYRWKKQLAKEPSANGTRRVDVGSDAQSAVPQATCPRLGSDATAHVSDPKTYGQPDPISLSQAFTEVRLVDSPAATAAPVAATAPRAAGTPAPTATPATFAARSTSATPNDAVPPASGLRVRLPDGTRISVRHDPATAALLINKLFPTGGSSMQQAAPADGNLPPIHHAAAREEQSC